ncbi:MAG: hypothetical protein M0C28_06355 [Candidatus Moduliflexus flocculans]|nr:hypothetical protein [Candidatus Moduliflexus flocculans]
MEERRGLQGRARARRRADGGAVRRGLPRQQPRARLRRGGLPRDAPTCFAARGIRTVGAGLTGREALAPLTVRRQRPTRSTIVNFSEGEDLTASPRRPRRLRLGHRAAGRRAGRGRSRSAAAW